MDDTWMELQNIELVNLDYSNIWRKAYFHKITQLRSFTSLSKKSPNYEHILHNVLGEIYETFVFELLLEWACKNNDVLDFFMKGPYVKKSSTHEGFSYNDNRQIIYHSDGIPLAEFDGLCRLKNCWVFFEISRSRSRNYHKDLEKRIEFKFNLLNEIFSEEFYCIVITPRKTSRFMKEEKKTVNWIVNEPEILEEKIVNYRKNFKHAQTPKFPKLKLIDELSFNDFSYRSREGTIRKSFFKLLKNQINFDKFRQEVQKHLIFVNKIVLGVVYKNSLNSFLQGYDVDQRLLNRINEKVHQLIIVCLRLDKNKVPHFTVYHKIKDKKRYGIYEYKISEKQIKYKGKLSKRQKTYSLIYHTKARSIKNSVELSLGEIITKMVQLNFDLFWNIE